MNIIHRTTVIAAALANVFAFTTANAQVLPTTGSIETQLLPPSRKYSTTSTISAPVRLTSGHYL